ncbi:MAG: hypothetical protein RIC14_05555 [Filomicrobium sp.]
MADDKYTAPSRKGKVNLAVWTDPERRQALKVAAAQTGKSVQEIVEDAIDRELKRLQK